MCVCVFVCLLWVYACVRCIFLCVYVSHRRSIEGVLMFVCVRGRRFALVRCLFRYVYVSHYALSNIY